MCIRDRLTGRTPPDELERILAYYTEYFDEAGPQGEGRVIRELGTPAELVGRVLGAQRSRTVPAERDCPPEGAARERHGLGTLWKVLLAICAAPIAIPLILVVVAMVLGLVVLILALVAGVAVGGVVAIGAGVFTACAGFSVLFSAGLPTMMSVSYTHQMCIRARCSSRRGSPRHRAAAPGTARWRSPPGKRESSDLR